MGKKAPKASRKLAASGELKRKIQERHKQQKVKKQIKNRKATKGKGREGENVLVHEPSTNDDEDDEEVEDAEEKFKGMTVDDFLGAGFMEGEDENDNEGAEHGSDDDDLASDSGSFSEVDDLSDDEGAAHLHELSKLAEKDPEFYKYLQEHDRELLEFNPDKLDEDTMMGDEDEEMEQTPILTKEILKSWQKALLEHRSLKALKKLLVAFRSAAHIQDEGETNVHLVWRIDDSSVYQKLVTTTLRYTPIVLDHHIAYKILPNGRYKQPPTSKKFTALTKLLLSHFHNIIRVIESLPQRSSEEDGGSKDVEMTLLALSESAKLLPYVIGSRKAVKVYLKTCLDLWSSAQDNVRIAAFLGIRRLALSSDESILDLILKGTYLALVRSSKSTSVHTLPSITLMKNSATELFCAPEHDSASYQHAFRYIRQLAILLRGGMKSMTKEAYKQVYNWQFVHCVDFWSLVLARGCNRDIIQTAGKESDLQALIYPLVQISTGSIQLVPNPRSYPFHLHIIRSLVYLSRHTTTYVPLTPYIIPIISYALSPSTSGKAASLRALPFDTTIRAPANYLRTRIYAECLAEESVYILVEWMATPQVQGSIAFPEISVPITMVLRKAVKVAKEGKGGKQVGEVKMLVERMEEGAKWIEEKRRRVTFAPADGDQVKRWESDLKAKLDESPIGKTVRVLRKAREKRRKLLEKAREGEDEILET